MCYRTRPDQIHYRRNRKQSLFLDSLSNGVVPFLYIIEFKKSAEKSKEDIVFRSFVVSKPLATGRLIRDRTHNVMPNVCYRNLSKLYTAIANYGKCIRGRKRVGETLTRRFNGPLDDRDDNISLVC